MTAEPVQEFFSIGEVCELTELKPHVLRYWESQFRFLNPAKNRSGNRVYQRREIELILLVKHLLYTEKYTIEGARQKVDEHRKGGELKHVARSALTVQTLELSLELSEGAMSHALGTEDLSAALDRELERQGASARQTGVLPLSLSAKDLWCDLAHGDATIRVHVIGTFGSQAYEGETLVTGVEPL